MARWGNTALGYAERPSSAVCAECRQDDRVGKEGFRIRTHPSPDPCSVTGFGTESRLFTVSEWSPVLYQANRSLRTEGRDHDRTHRVFLHSSGNNQALNKSKV